MRRPRCTSAGAQPSPCGTVRARAGGLTDDVDGAFRKDPVVLEVAARIAEREGLQADWVNDKFTGFIPGAQEDTEAATHRLGGLTVRFASDRFLLAMKMQAGRTKDLADSRLLIRRLRLNKATDIAALTCDLYGDAAVPAVDFDDMRFHARRMLASVRRDDPTWQADPDDPVAPTVGQFASSAPHRGRTTPASNAGSFRARRNVPPATELTAD
jgi:hypothetical protein